MVEDYYSLLDVEPSASEEAILRAYREKAAEMHPDVSEDPDAGEAFKQVNRAKSVLTDEKQRRRYDRLGHDRFVAETTDKESEGARKSPAPNPAGERSGRSGASNPFPFDIGQMISFFVDPSQGHRRHHRSVGRDSENQRSQGSTAADGPGVIDLRSLLRQPRRVSDQRNEDPRWESRVAPNGDGEQCPTCGGRGSIEHIIDTAAGRRRRRERCDRCEGAGVVQNS